MSLTKQLSELQARNKQRFENLKCVNYAMYFGCIDAVCDCGEERCKNRQTVEMAEEEYKEYLDQITTDSFNAGALAVIGECKRLTKENVPYVTGDQDRLLAELTTLEAKIKNV